MNDDDFGARVAEVLHRLQPGDVTTYGEVAAEAGTPGAARAVGRILREAAPGEFPWWRVVAASGRLVPGGEAEHALRLQAEGVEIENGKVAKMRRR
jgi:methylated-DNA-protein-cysteine methyltransferase-like protein